jgi:hypothetical protein
MAGKTSPECSLHVLLPQRKGVQLYWYLHVPNQFFAIQFTLLALVFVYRRCYSAKQKLYFLGYGNVAAAQLAASPEGLNSWS